MSKIETAKPCDYLPKTTASDGIEVTIEDCTSDEDDRESLEGTLDEDDQESLNSMFWPIISSKKTTESQIEGNKKGIASVEKELNPKAETTIVKKKDIEEEVQRNTKRIECLEKELDEIRRSKETITEELEKRIKALEEEKQDLIERNKELEKQLQVVNERLKKIEEENKENLKKIQEENRENLKKIQEENRENLKKIQEENKEKDARIEKLEKDRDYNQSVLILIQIGTTLQRNRCKYVLGKDFKESFFYKYGKIDDYIKTLVPARDQNSAKKRLQELEEKSPWDQHLVDSLKKFNGARITIAHPKLSSENIQKATEDLKGMDIIDDEMVKNIRQLKELWETSEDLLQ